MENMSKDINLDNLAQFEKLQFKEGIDRLSETIEEIDALKTKTPKWYTHRPLIVEAWNWWEKNVFPQDN